MAHAARSLSGGLLVLVVLGACARASAPDQSAFAPTMTEVQPAVASLEARFDPTAAVGGGANASGSISADELTRTFAPVAQAAKLGFTASASPPGATGAAVQSVSITAQDVGGILASLGAADKRALGEALLNAAATTWPQARITLLVTGAGQIIATRPPGGPNTVIAS